MSIAQNKLVYEDCKRACIDIDSFSTLKNNTVLVTGGTGFVGKWISEMISYINENESYNINLYLLGRDISNFRNQVPHLAEKKFIKLIEQDVRYIHSIPDEVNFIIHAAGTPDSRFHVSEPLKTIETIYKGTQSLLDAATRLSSLKKIICLSSHQVYGKNESRQRMTENFLGILSPISANNCYEESKRISETLCSYYRNYLKLPILILRPFAFLGPYQSLEKPWAINSFIRDSILGGPIRILGNGLTERSYLYAGDMAYWILKSLVAGNIGEVYNLGSNKPISLNDLAFKIQGQFQTNIEIISKSAKEIYDSSSFIVPDTEKTTTELGVKENFNVDYSIERTIKWNNLANL